MKAFFLLQFTLKMVSDHFLNFYDFSSYLSFLEVHTFPL